MNRRARRITGAKVEEVTSWHPAASPRRHPFPPPFLPFISPRCRRQILFKADLSSPGSEIEVGYYAGPGCTIHDATPRLKKCHNSKPERLFEHFRRSSTSCARIHPLSMFLPSPLLLLCRSTATLPFRREREQVQSSVFC